MAKQGIHIIVGASYTDKDLKRAQADLNRLGVAAKRAQTPFQQFSAGLRKSLVPSLAMVGAAVGAMATKFLIDGVKSAAAEETAIARLDQALKNVGSTMSTDTVDVFIDGMARATGVADDQLRPAMITLVNATRDAAESQRLLQLALDISAGSGRDLSSVTTALAKAANGQTTALRRLGVPLSDAAIKSGDLAIISAELSDTFGGQASRAANTFEGRMKRLNVAFGELQEAIGVGFIAAIEDGDSATESLGDTMQALEPYMEAVGAKIGEQVQGFAALAEIIALVGDKTAEANVKTDGFVQGFLDSPAWWSPARALIEINKWMKENGWLTGSAAEQHEDYRDAVVRAHDATSGAIGPTTELGDEVTETGDAADEAAEYFQNLNDELKIFTDFTDKREDVRAYQASLDDLRKSVKENGKAFGTATPKARENQDALDGIYDAAVKVAEGQQTAAEKIATMQQAASDADAELKKAGVPADVRAALLEPFDTLIAKFTENNTLAGNLKQRMEELPPLVEIEVRTNYTSSGVPGPYAGKPVPRSSGGLITGAGTSTSDSIPVAASNGEFMVRASMVDRIGIGALTALNSGRMPQQWYRPGPSSATSDKATAAGVTFGDIIVQGAPAEAVESLPRRLRHEMYLAGL